MLDFLGSSKTMRLHAVVSLLFSLSFSPFGFFSFFHCAPTREYRNSLSTEGFERKRRSNGKKCEKKTLQEKERKREEETSEERNDRKYERELRVTAENGGLCVFNPPLGAAATDTLLPLSP